MNRAGSVNLYELFLDESGVINSGIRHPSAPFDELDTKVPTADQWAAAVGDLV